MMIITNSKYLIDDYEAYVEEQQARLVKEESYFQKFSYQPEVERDIQREQKEVAGMIEDLRQKIKIKEELEALRREPIGGHPEYRRMRVQERQEGRERSWKWKEYVKVNHEVEVRIKIVDILPVFRENESNEVSFQALRFHLHLADQQDCTSMLRYHPKHNLYYEKELIQGRLMKSERNIELRIKHCIRSHNIILYSDLFEEGPIKIIAEASYGLVLGIANLYIDDFSTEDQPIHQQFRCVSFKTYHHQEGEEGQSERTVFIAKIHISVDSRPVAPEMQELKHNAEKEFKKRETSKSKSPNRVISTAPARSASPKRKRQLITGITSTQIEATHLTVYQGFEYRYKLASMGNKREITYRQLKNIHERRIELVKIQENFYLKCFLVRETAVQKGQIRFQLNQQSFTVHVIQDKLYRVIDLPTYTKSKQPQQLQNKLVSIGEDVLIYPRENNRILKNMIRQITTDGLPCSIFLKTIFSQCDITTRLPFVITDILHKEDGYMINYYFAETQALEVERQTLLLFFLESRYKQINEIHIFDCSVQPRTVQRDTLYRQLRLSPQSQFHSIPLDSITSQSYEYRIRTTNPSIRLINGDPFRFSPSNPQLHLQISHPIPAQVDLIFTDSKSRSFFMRVSLL